MRYGTACHGNSNFSSMHTVASEMYELTHWVHQMDPLFVAHVRQILSTYTCVD